MIIHTDGWTKDGNPSPSGGGYTIISVDDYLMGEGRVQILEQQEYARPMTNNEAEVLGLIASLRIAQKGDVIVTDSTIALSWLHRGSAPARPDLDPILAGAKRMADEKKARIKNYNSLDDAEIVIEWRPRDQNEAGKFNEIFH